MVHNESFNIWSHLSGFIVYFILIFITLFVIQPHTFYLKDIQAGYINNEFENITNPLFQNIYSFRNITYNRYVTSYLAIISKNHFKKRKIILITSLI